MAGATAGGDLGVAKGRIEISSEAAVAAIKATVSELNKLKTVSPKVAESLAKLRDVSGLKSLGSESAKAGKALQQDLARGAVAAAKSLDTVETKSASTSAVIGKMSAAIATGAAAGGAALAAFAVKGVNAAGDLEQSIANISTIKPDIDTSAVFASLNEMQTRVPQTATQLGDSLYNIFSSVSVSQKEALQLVEEFSRSAVGAGTSAETFGTAALGVMNAYGLAVSDAQHISDVFFNTVNLGVVSGQELASSLGPVTQSAKAAGVSLDELGGFIAGITKEGGPASQNINNLNNFLQKITTKDAQKELNALGVATADATGAFRPTVDVLADLKLKLGDMTEAARTNALQAIFPDAQARIGAQTLISQLDFVKQAIDTNINSAGSATAAYEKMSQTFNSQVALAKNAFTALATTVGSALLPVLTDVIKNGLIPGIDSVRDFTEQITNSRAPLETFTRLLNNAVPGLGTASRNLVTMGSALSDALVPALAGASAATSAWALGKLATNIGAASVATKAWVLALSPLAVGATVIGVAIGALAYAVGQYNDQIDETTRKSLALDTTLKSNARVAGEFATTQAGQTEQGRDLLSTLGDLEGQYADLQTQLEKVKDPILDRDPNNTYEKRQAEIAKITDAQKELANRMGVTRNQIKELSDSEAAHAKAMEEAAAGTFKYQDAYERVGAAAEEAARRTQEALDLKAIDQFYGDLDKARDGAISALFGIVTAEADVQDQRETLAQSHEERLQAIYSEFGGQKAAEADKAGKERIRVEQENYTAELANANLSYAAQIDAQRRALGQMLIDRVNAMIGLNQVDAGRGAELINFYRREFGVIPTIAETAFAETAAAGDRFLRDNSVTMSQAAQDTQDAVRAATDLKTTYDNLRGLYEAEIRANTTDAEEKTGILDERLANLEKRVLVTIEANPELVGQTFDTLDELDAAVAEVRVARIHTEIDTGDTPARLQEMQGQVDTLNATPVYVPTSTNAPETTSALQDTITALDTLDRHPPVEKSVNTNAPVAAGEIRDTSTALDELDRHPPVHVSVTTDAASVAGALDAASGALARLQQRAANATTVRIHAEIDGPIEAHSPSPMELSLARTADLIKAMPTLQLRTDGIERFRDALSALSPDTFTGGFADTPAPLGLDNLRETFTAGLAELARQAREGSVDVAIEIADGLVRELDEKKPAIERAIQQPVIDALTEKLPPEARTVARTAGAGIVTDIVVGAATKLPALERSMVNPITGVLTDKLPAAARGPARAAGAAIQQDVQGGYAERQEDWQKAILNPIEGVLGAKPPPSTRTAAEVFGGTIADDITGGYADKKPIEQIVSSTVADWKRGVEAIRRALRDGGSRISDELLQDRFDAIGRQIAGGDENILDRLKLPSQSIQERLDGLGSDTGQSSAESFFQNWRDALDQLQPEAVVDLTDWWQSLRREAVAPALFALAEQTTFGGQTAIASLNTGLSSGLDGINSTVSSINEILASITRDVTVNIHANVDEVLQRHSPSIIEQTLMSIHSLAGSVPRVDLQSIGALAFRSQSIGAFQSARSVSNTTHAPVTNYHDVQVILPAGSSAATLHAARDGIREAYQSMGIPT